MTQFDTTKLVGLDGKALKNLNTGDVMSPRINRTKIRISKMIRDKHDKMIASGNFDPGMFMRDFQNIFVERLRNYELYTGESVDIMNRKSRSDRADLSDINNKIHASYFQQIVTQGVDMLNSNPTDFGYDNSKQIEEEMIDYQNKLLKSGGEFEIENINEEPIEIAEFKSLMNDVRFQSKLYEVSTYQDATGVGFWLCDTVVKNYSRTNDDGESSFTVLDIKVIEPWYGERLENSAVVIETAWTEKGELYYIMKVYYEGDTMIYKSSVVADVTSNTEELLLDLVFEKHKVTDVVDEQEVEIETIKSPLGMIPLIEFVANANRMSVFHMVEDIINAVDLTISDQQNEIEQFRLAYLFVSGDGMTREVAEKILQKGGIIATNSPDANVKYLTKELNVDFNKYHLDKMIELIYSQSNSINFSSDAFSGSGSGETRQWQIKPLEDRTKVKEIFIQDSLREFSEIVQAFMELPTSSYDDIIEADKIIYAFRRSVPIDIVYIADAISKVKGVVSNYTLSGFLPNVESKSREQMLLRIEKAEDMQSQMSAVRAEQDNQEPLKVGDDSGTGGNTTKDRGAKASGEGSKQKGSWRDKLTLPKNKRD